MRGAGAPPPDAGEFSEICKTIPYEHSFLIFKREYVSSVQRAVFCTVNAQELKYNLFINHDRIADILVFSPILQRISKPSVKFSHVWSKTQFFYGKLSENSWTFWWKFDRKMEFLSIFGRLLLNIDPSEITTLYDNTFSVSVEGWNRPAPYPSYATVWIQSRSRMNI